MIHIKRDYLGGGTSQSISTKDPVTSLEDLETRENYTIDNLGTTENYDTTDPGTSEDYFTTELGPPRTTPLQT